MRQAASRVASIIAAFLCVLLIITAWAFTPAPIWKKTPGSTPRLLSRNLEPDTLKRTPQTSVKRDSTVAAASSTGRAADPSIPLVKEQVLFYNIEKNAIEKEVKSFYWVSLPSGLRRFDAKLPATAFRKNFKGRWVVSTEIVSLTKKMAQRLYKEEEAKATYYFGQYYPDIMRKETKMTTGILEGINFSGSPKNAVFYSLTAGTVEKVVPSFNSDEYSYLLVRMDDDQSVYYIHGSSYFVKEGDKVKAGTKLGRQGDRGSKGVYQVHVSLQKPDSKDFSRSKDTELENEVPYEFWAKWIQ